MPTEELAALDPDASKAASPPRSKRCASTTTSRPWRRARGDRRGWQILTRAEYTEAIERAQLAARPARLSAAALETLALIAYRQPIGRAEIEEIRGVSVGSVLKSLHERGLIDVVGRGEGLGRPLLYGTTPIFLEYFALRHLEELPRSDELAVALRAEPRDALMSEPMRIQRALARAGVLSRRKAEELMAERPRHGERHARAGSGRRVDPERDVIKVDGAAHRRAGAARVVRAAQASRRDHLQHDPEGRRRCSISCRSGPA